MTHVKISQDVVDGLHTALCGYDIARGHDDARHVPACDDDKCQDLLVTCPTCIRIVKLIRNADRLRMEDE